MDFATKANMFIYLTEQKKKTFIVQQNHYIYNEFNLRIFDHNAWC